MSVHDNGSQLRSVLPFTAEPVVVRDLRRAVRGQLVEWQLSAFIEEAELAVSELAVNVINHVGRGAAATLVLETAGARLRIELHDESYRLPVLGPVACEDECGRGLHLLAGMAADWGTLLTATGKAVWCELSGDPEMRCRRVQRAEAALAKYRSDVGAPPLLQSRSAQILEESAIDLIADVLHWVTARGGDPDSLLDRAQMHFEAETA
ncbi:ATP-binding protein [Streptomyces sp. NPDC101194]|uniref:ATP-binding protein n=1 Tax=Streptomyces sp. NPDC101194 TaxID=3366127 RepID=UPI003822E235